MNFTVEYLLNIMKDTEEKELPSQTVPSRTVPSRTALRTLVTDRASSTA